MATCEGRLGAFLERYLPLFYRKEQRVNAGVVIRGLLSDLERKTCEPLACREGRERKPVQFFVGRGLWDDDRVTGERRRRRAMSLLEEEAKGGTGLAHYEVRSWVGWHHHVTLSLPALWFAATEARRLGGKITRGDGAAAETGLLKAAS